jgi:hypothetical protein
MAGTNDELATRFDLSLALAKMLGSYTICTNAPVIF